MMISLGDAPYGSLAWAQEQAYLLSQSGAAPSITPVTAAGVPTSTGETNFTPTPSVIQVVGPEPAPGLPMPSTSNTVQCDHLASVFPASWPAGQPINRQTVDAFFLQQQGQTLTQYWQTIQAGTCLGLGCAVKEKIKAIVDCLTAQEQAASSGAGAASTNSDKTMLYVGIAAAVLLLFMMGGKHS